MVINFRSVGTVNDVKVFDFDVLFFVSFRETGLTGLSACQSFLPKGHSGTGFLIVASGIEYALRRPLNQRINYIDAVVIAFRHETPIGQGDDRQS